MIVSTDMTKWLIRSSRKIPTSWSESHSGALWAYSLEARRRAQMMHCWEIRVKQQRHHDEDDQQPPIQKVWQPKMQSQIHRQDADLIMVFVLSWDSKLCWKMAPILMSRRLLSYC
jgi:hypothetical protein